MKWRSIVVVAFGTLPLFSAGAGADSDGAGCWGCLSRVLAPGWECSNGALVEHLGGGLMQGGWWGYKAEHKAALCGYCNVHSTCLWGDECDPQDPECPPIEPELAIMGALRTGDWSEVKTRLASAIRVEPESNTLHLVGCDGEKVMRYVISDAAVSALLSE